LAGLMALGAAGCAGSAPVPRNNPAPVTTASTQANDVLTYHNDVGRTGLMPNETILTSANVNSTSFGLLMTLPVDGKVDAEPLYVSNVGSHNLLLVATEHASVYAFDADSGSIVWQVSLLHAGETTSDDHRCGQVSPEIGVTSTPVVDRGAGPHGTVYTVAMSKNGSGTYFQRLHALDLTTGAEQFGGPQNVAATFPGAGDNSSGGMVVFDPGQYKERPGLLLLNGVVYTSWSSHCDFRPYTGWLIGYDQMTLAQTSVLNVTPNGNEGSFWNSGAAPAADAGGNIIALQANGTFDATLDAQGFPSQRNFGNSFLKISTTSRQLAVADYFAPFNVANENSVDEDLGSGAALVLPDLTDSLGHTRHLAVGAGKDAHIYVVDRDNMGKFNPANNSQVYQDINGQLGGQVFSMPAYFNGTIYYGAVGDTVKAFPIASALVAGTPSSQSSHSFGFPGTTPSISSNGATNGIVWAAENTNPAVLHAYDATNLSRELYNSNQAANGRDHFGAGNKFITPMIAHGKVYVGTTNGVGVFGLIAH
jgi:outer membrane protein assembly factor BamB